MSSKIRGHVEGKEPRRGRHTRPSWSDCGLDVPEIHGKRAGFAHASIEDFTYRLATNQPFITDLRDGICVSKTILAILESAEKREPVAVAL